MHRAILSVIAVVTSLLLTGASAWAQSAAAPVLRPGEFAVRTANGCTIVLTLPPPGDHPAPRHFPVFEPTDKTEAGLRAWYGARNWTGECRAGLAHNGGGLVGTPDEIAQLEKMKAERGGYPVLRRVPTLFHWGRVYPAMSYSGRDMMDIVQGGSRAENEFNGEYIVVQDLSGGAHWQQDGNGLQPYTYLFAPDGSFTYTAAIMCSIARDKNLVPRCRDQGATIYGYYIGKGAEETFKPCPDMRTTAGCEAAWRNDTVALRQSISAFFDRIREASLALEADPVIMALATADTRARVRARPANVAAIMRQLGVN